jgi:hypothetical protein
MHEIEDLVQWSIEALDEHFPDGDPRVRDWIVRLFAFQREYDCSHTQHRVLDILLRRGHTLRFPLPPSLAGITEFTTLRVFPPDEVEFVGDLEDGYVDPPWLYAEAGTDLWRTMTGPDRREPAPARLIDVVVEIASASPDVELIARWHALGPGGLEIVDPMDDPAALRLREIVARTGADQAELPDGLRPSDEHLDLMDDELETWWYRVRD